MDRYIRQNGFSLTEVLMATGILAIGLMMIAMVFPVGVKLAGITTERTIGVVAANEAFAKMQLYGIQPFSDTAKWGMPPRDPNTTCTDYWQVCATAMPLKEINDQRCYPSLIPQPMERRYYWSALVRRANPNTNEVQATVFVCRMMGMSAKYYTPAGATNGQWPVPVKVNIAVNSDPNYIDVQPTIAFPPLPPSTTQPVYAFFTEGCMIVEDTNGNEYQVMETKDMDANPGKEKLRLSGPIAVTGLPPYSVWVVPPAIGSSRSPCIDVVQQNPLFQ
jgi:prepilin-type N-terminal cleavage/methylation domain-containing protein